MKETRDIIAAYQKARLEGSQAVLATVVKVEGSSYRQPGARMLVTEDGHLTGAISGGCLEGDALRKALLCLNQKQNKLVTYDTSRDDDAAFGVQLGCNGIVHILFEYIDAEKPDNPLELLKRIENDRREAVTLTLFSPDRVHKQPGTILYQKAGADAALADERYRDQIAPASETLRLKATCVKDVDTDVGRFQGLFQFHEPTLSVVVAGAGNDVMPLARMADVVGWDVTIVDGRATHARSSRFPEASQVLMLRATEVLDTVAVDFRTVFLLMTHNYQYDLALLKALLPTSVPYIGILGPKSKFDRMEVDLLESGIAITDSDKHRIYNPVGLDIGAETSEEIAVSVIAEIQAFLHRRDGSPLRLKQGKIHNSTLEAL